ncbi:hypothetical protein ACFWNN_03615 [Lentzea sp. NPDC058450]|uniref:hypothetical protein n=1 Tax=Lentzea sp. NPDC058450 TaxID=3346505 RepID=UPI00366340DF
MRVLLALAATVLLASPALAVPPDGASPDTPGTTATVSPRSAAPGQRITFTLGGFPAGEIVSVKIDDGRYCEASAVHGACVVHKQKVTANGTVTGEIPLPADLPAGQHWLRFLASQPILDGQGNQQGVRGFTSRGQSDFTLATPQAPVAPPPTQAPAPTTAAPAPTSAAPPATTTTPAEAVATTVESSVPQPVPVAQQSSLSGVMVWVLGGAGVIAVLAVALVLLARRRPPEHEG